MGQINSYKLGEYSLKSDERKEFQEAGGKNSINTTEKLKRVKTRKRRKIAVDF